MDECTEFGRRLRSPRRIALAATILMTSWAAPALSAAQTTAPAGPVQMPPVIVTAQKEPAEAQKLPVSVTAVPAETIDRAGVVVVSDAALQAPNTNFTEFTARKLSNATFRGIGSSPANAGITTVVDGVPQLNTNSSSLTLLQVEQIEFVRGPQSPLFGRNMLGGLVNVTSRRPGLASWEGDVRVPFGSEATRGVQGSLSGPIRPGTLGLGVAFDFTERDGFTRNDLTGNDLDSRSAFSGKAQLVWTPSPIWEARAILGGERARDGDYALGDLDALRASPFHVSRDFEGRTDRDVVSTTFLTRRQGGRVTFSTVTGLVRWEARDVTDLDYTPVPLARRDNQEQDRQFTHEARLASSAGSPVRVSDSVAMHWQAGLFLFTQNYEQDAINSYAPSLISPFIPFGLDQHIPQSVLDDAGVGVFGQATLTFQDRLDVSLGARADQEWKDATLNTFFSQSVPGLPSNLVEAERSFTNVSPQAGVAFRLRPDRMIYASFAEGFKAGGFNPASPVGSEIYDEEHAWHTEVGWKSSWAGGRLLASAAGFYIDWSDIQLNLPDPVNLGQFYIANVGAATSRGVEVDLTARAHPNVSLFGSFGYTRARFKAGSRSAGADVGGKTLPNTPSRTAMVGLEASRPVGQRLSLVGRVESAFYGTFEYNNANTARQDAYSLTNLRASLRGERLIVEAWARNLFDTFYVPVAFEYQAFAPSGFIGEPGKPRTFGVNVGVTF
jgi:iron complex outermembrane receptor protein